MGSHSSFLFGRIPLWSDDSLLWRYDSMIIGARFTSIESRLTIAESRFSEVVTHD